MVGEVEGMARYIDNCCANHKSKMELVSIAKEFRLDVEGCSFWWLDVNG